MPADQWAQYAEPANAGPPPTGDDQWAKYAEKKDEANPSLLDTAEHYGRQFLTHMGTAADSIYPVRLAKGIYGRITNQPGSKEAMGDIATDAIRDFAVAGAAGAAGPESAPERKPALAIERGPRYMWGKTIPDESGAAPFPEKPPAEVLRASGLGTGAQPVPSAPGAELGRLPTPAQPAAALREIRTPASQPAAVTGEALGSIRPRAVVPEPAPAAAPITQKAVGSALERSLGAEPLKSDVPLRRQITPRAEPVSQSKAESSVIRSHEYDPQAREMHVGTKSNPNITYVYGDVDPEQAQIFDKSESKGKAWAEFKKGGSPLVAKIVNGERIPVRPVIRAEDMNPQGGSRVLRNPAPAENEDLTGQLRDSLRDALNRRQPKSRVSPPR